jgi:hypothetical protein
MMDFGLAGLFERFEKSLGRKFTTFIEVTIAIAIVSTCLGLIWSFLSPIVLWLGGEEGPSTFSRQLSLGVGSLLVLAAGAAGLVCAFEARKATREARKVLEETKGFSKKTAETMDEILELQSRLNTEEKKPR